jgi:hypothetical protein
VPARSHGRESTGQQCIPARPAHVNVKTARNTPGESHRMS